MLWLPPVRYQCTNQTHYLVFHKGHLDTITSVAKGPALLLLLMLISVQTKNCVKFNCCSKAHFSIQTGNWNSFRTLVLLVAFNREQFSAPRSTSNISTSCSVFSQTHIHAALFTTTQPNLKCESKAHPAIVSIQNAFCDPNVGAVHMEEMRFPNKDGKIEAKFEKLQAFCSVLPQHLPRAPLHQKNGCLWENNFSF